MQACHSVGRAHRLGMIVAVVLAVVGGGLVACSSSPSSSSSGRQPLTDGGKAGGEETDGEDAGSNEPSGPMTLTSGAFEDGAKLPSLHTCDGDGSKKNVSPPLSWTPGPEGTKSYAIVFIDNT